MTTQQKKRMPEITGAFKHRDHPGKIILQAQDGSCCLIDAAAFNSYSEREFVPRTAIADGAWKVSRIGLTTVPLASRAPIRGRTITPLAESMTARSMERKTGQKLKDWLDDYAEKPHAGEGDTAD